MLVGCAFCASEAYGVDGVIEINQAKVEAAGGFPFIISASGSYRLTSNLDILAAGQTDPQTRIGIMVNALDDSNVDIDLNGFTIVGPITCGIAQPPFNCTPAVVGSAEGILVTNGIVRVHDGAIQGFAGTGLDTAAPAQIRNLDVKWCHHGIVTGLAAVENVTLFMNRGQGIVAIFSVLDGIVSRFNGDDGIAITSSVLRNCTSTVNGGDEIFSEAGSVVVDCTTATP